MDSYLGDHGVEFWSSQNLLLFLSAAMLFYIVQGISVPTLYIIRLKLIIVCIK
jgi:hypothetical protein